MQLVRMSGVPGSSLIMEVLYIALVFLCLVNRTESACDKIYEGVCDVDILNEVYEKDDDNLPREISLEIALPPEVELQLLLDLKVTDSELTNTTKDLIKTSQYYNVIQSKHDTEVLLISRTNSGDYLVQGEVAIDIHTLRFTQVYNSSANQDANIHHYLVVGKCPNDMFQDDDTEQHSDQRQKRSLHTYSVELLMVVDSAIYSWWKSLLPSSDTDSHIVESIKQYYAYVLKEIDNRFLSIRQDVYEINMAFSELIIAKTDEESYWTSTSIVEEDTGSPKTMVNSSEALEKFQQWLDNQTDLPHFDHAILFTGCDLTYAGNPGNTGLAFEASMCRNISNSSIVEEAFDARTATFAVRQIARSLGARDDMDNNDCLEFFNYIMAPKFKLPIKSFPSNRWLFSTCSIQYFHEYIESLNEDGLNCLQDITLSERFPLDITQLVEQLPGKYYSAKRQCENKFGNGSDICRVEIGRDYGKLCTGLRCTVPSTDTCSVILPCEGTPCGNMKYCHGGECVEFEDAEKRVDSCVYGNEPGFDCEGIIGNISSMCYNDTVSAYCCMSCAARETGLSDCRYGDRTEDCCKEECTTRGEAYKNVDCCLTCLDGPVPYPTPATNGITSFISKSASVQAQTKASFTASTKSVSASLAVGDLSTLLASFSTERLSSSSYSLDNTVEIQRDQFGRSDTPNLPSTAPGQPVIAMGMTPVPQIDYTTHGPGQPSFDSQSNFQKTRVDINNGEVDTVVRMADTDNNKGEMTTIQPRRPQPKKACDTRKTDPSPTKTSVSATMLVTGPPITTDRIPTLNLATTTMASTNRDYQNDRDRSLSIYDRIFFKELARSMRRSQRIIRYRVQQAVKYLYRSVSRQIGNFQETEGENDYAYPAHAFGEMPSNDDEDLNRQLKPIWQKLYRSLVKDLQGSIKRMRYQVLMMVNRHLRQ